MLQTDRRQTDDDTLTYSERECKFTFANKSVNVKRSVSPHRTAFLVRINPVFVIVIS